MSKLHRIDHKSRARGSVLQGDHLDALGSFLEMAFPDPAQLFDHGLALLVQRLHADRAVMTRLTDLGLEAFWWSMAGGVPADHAISEPDQSFCPLVLEHPDRTLVVRDALSDPRLHGHSAFRKLGIRSYIGAPLRQSGKVMGVLSIQCSQPRSFSRAEIAMLKAMADLMSRTLEVETLKAELQMTRDALDLTTAVVEDSALESPVTRLPNRHYLDIWLKANLYLARRKVEVMTVVAWTLPVTQDAVRKLRAVADALRGEDLLVDYGKDHFLLLLPRTGRDGAQILLERIQAKLGAVPMGATLWQPLHRLDHSDISIRHATHRAMSALRKHHEGRQGVVCWESLEMKAEDLVDLSAPWGPEDP